MVVRVKDGGESKCRAVMARIRAATPTRKRADFLLVFRHERTWPIGLTGSADDGASWCSPEPKPGMGSPQLASHRKRGSPTPGAYREGSATRQIEQGESPTTFADALGERQISRGTPGHGERREGNPWRRQGTLGYASEETGRSIVASGAGVSSSTVAANLYS
jgi:hypothetical protein